MYLEIIISEISSNDCNAIVYNNFMFFKIILA
jgi:hypothetical protein